MFLTSRMKAFHSVYLSADSQLKLGCLSAGLPILGPAVFGILFACILARAWIADLVASAMAFINASFKIDCSTIFDLLF